MVRNRRLSSEERKKEIMSAAARFFVEKGFTQTTMEDVISGTSLSKGGVYHYYKNTIDILRDLMVAGNNYRLAVIRNSIGKYKHDDDLNFFANEIVEKMVDNNEFMPIYVMFLIEAKRNDELKALYEQLKMDTIEEYCKLAESLNMSFVKKALDDFITHFINSIIIGADVLGARDCFIQNKQLLVAMVKVFFEERFKYDRGEEKE